MEFLKQSYDHHIINDSYQYTNYHLVSHAFKECLSETQKQHKSFVTHIISHISSIVNEKDYNRFQFLEIKVCQAKDLTTVVTRSIM